MWTQMLYSLHNVGRVSHMCTVCQILDINSNFSVCKDLDPFIVCISFFYVINVVCIFEMSYTNYKEFYGQCKGLYDYVDCRMGHTYIGLARVAQVINWACKKKKKIHKLLKPKDFTSFCKCECEPWTRAEVWIPT